MIKLADLYQATNDGLDIICMYYPEARACADDKRKKFKIRDERTPSATLWMGKSDGVPCWKVTDFGGVGEAISPIDLAMSEENLRFSEVVLKLAGIFNVTNELNKRVNTPQWVTEVAPEGAMDGEAVFTLKDGFSDSTLRILGPKVTAEVAQSLGWAEAESFGFVKDGQLKLRKSTDTYPILMRRCDREATPKEPASTFYKVYEPLNADKGYRFSYTPKGCSPGNYIHGLVELKKRFREYNKQEEAKFVSLPENEGKIYVEKKLPECIICSGERDALCVAALGYCPIWLNSETKDWTESMMAELRKYTEIVYNIPDIDTTGRRRGTALALAHIDVHTIWLPEWLKEYKDNRGHARKDFRDWVELRDRKKDFEQLLNLSYPAKFWLSHVNKKSGKVSHRIDTVCLHYFLSLSGFYMLKDGDGGQRWVKVRGNHVDDLKPKHIRQFLRRWSEDNFLDREIINEIINSPRLTDAALEHLREVDLDFKSYTSDSQLMFFGDNTIKVTADAIDVLDSKNTDCYVWEQDVFPCAFKKLDPMFEVTSKKTLTGKTAYNVKVKNTESNFFKYLINTSRLYWRKELEEQFKDEDASASEEYFKNNRFRIDGEGLTEEEIADQCQNLASKMFAVGYMLHAYKSPSRAWAPFAMDNRIGEKGECNGRSGKSFFFVTLANFLRRVSISGRWGKKIFDNPHIYEQVNRYTDFILIDDLDSTVKLESFYDMITGEITVNPKNNAIFTLSFEESPKIAFTSNYVPEKFDASTMARLLPMVFSDYYHEATAESDYIETRRVYDDFGRDLFTKSYTNDEWNADINFLLQCLSFYFSAISSGEKVLPPMDTIIKRKLLADIDGDFKDWAEVAFAPGSPNLNCKVIKEDLLADFQRHAGGHARNMSMSAFTRKLKSFTEFSPHLVTFDPKERYTLRKEDRQVTAGIIYSVDFVKKTNDEFKPDQENIPSLL